MGLRRIVLLGLCAGIFALAAPRDAHATYIKIGEVMTGTHLDPNVQYVVLRFEAAGGSSDGYTLYQFDNSGVGSGVTYLTGSLGNNQKGATILIASPAAEAFFRVTPDYVMAQPLMAQGALCLVGKDKALTQYDDCITWGGAVFPAQHGTPATVNAFNPQGGIQPGMVVQRITNSSQIPTNIRTDRDFWTNVRPWPQNNAGMLGASPPSICGNSAMEGLEECDEGSSNGISSLCTLDCKLKAGDGCPNGVVEPGEQCDDRNTVNHDGCSPTCRWESLSWGNAAAGMGSACGNHVLEVGEHCDPPNTQNCDPNCKFNASVQRPLCGDGAVEAPANPDFTSATDPNAQEQCDFNDGAAPACSQVCRWPANHPVATCGNRVVELGEQCDDGNQDDQDGCDKQCQFETQTSQVSDAGFRPGWKCGDGFLSPGEACDHGANNGVGNDACKSDCTLVNPPTYQSNAIGGTNTAGTVTGATNTGGTVTGATTTAGTTTGATNTAGTTTEGTNVGGTTTAGTNTGGTTTEGTNTGGTTTAGTDVGGTNTGGTVTGATTTAGTVTGATTTAGTVTGATTTAGTVTGATVTGGVLIPATNTGGTVTGASNTGGTVTGATTTAGEPGGTTAPATTTGGAATGDATAGPPAATTTSGATVSIDGSGNGATTSPKDVKGVSCRNVDAEGAAWLVLVFGVLAGMHRATNAPTPARVRRPRRL